MYRYELVLSRNLANCVSTGHRDIRAKAFYNCLPHRSTNKNFSLAKEAERKRLAAADGLFIFSSQRGFLSLGIAL
jgi:hypothetical protein